MSSLLQVSKLAYSYNNEFGISDISFNLNEGKVLAIVGHSGSGKSTLIKSIYGLLDLDEGEVICNNSKVYGPSFQLIPGHAEMKYVSQEADLMNYHKVHENISFHLRPYLNEFIHERTQEILQLVELEDQKDKIPPNLSGGQKQRLTIAKAIADEPKLLLLDEPFNHLDVHIKESILNYLSNSVKQLKTSVIFVTHDGKDALRWADKIIVMESGKIEQIGTPETMYHNPKTPFIAGLFGRANYIQKSVISSKQSAIESKILIRPENIQLSTKRNSHKATIVSSSYYGGYWEHQAILQKENQTIFFNHPQKLQGEVSVQFHLNSLN